MRSLQTFTKISIPLSVILFFTITPLQTHALILQAPAEQEYIMVSSVLVLMSLFFILATLGSLASYFIVKFFIRSFKDANVFLQVMAMNISLFLIFVLLTSIISLIADQIYSGWMKELDNYRLQTNLSLGIFLILGLGMIGLTRLKKKLSPKFRRILLAYGAILTIAIVLLTLVILTTDPETEVLSCYGPTCPGGLL